MIEPLEDASVWLWHVHLARDSRAGPVPLPNIGTPYGQATEEVVRVPPLVTVVSQQFPSGLFRTSPLPAVEMLALPESVTRRRSTIVVLPIEVVCRERNVPCSVLVKFSAACIEIAARVPVEKAFVVV